MAAIGTIAHRTIGSPHLVLFRQTVLPGDQITALETNLPQIDLELGGRLCSNLSLGSPFNRSQSLVQPDRAEIHRDKPGRRSPMGIGRR
jgi:hypothetical protein